LCTGSINDNSEILPKAALKAAAAFDPSITGFMDSRPSVAVPRNPKQLIHRTIIPSRGNEEEVNESAPVELDDRETVFNTIMDADALIIAIPVYSH